MRVKITHFLVVGPSPAHSSRHLNLEELPFGSSILVWGRWVRLELVGAETREADAPVGRP